MARDPRDLTPYQQKFLDPRWQKKRREVLQRDKWTCQFCRETTQTLDVHHCRYHRGMEPWDYPTVDLLTLCRPCHEGETTLGDDARLRAAGFVREIRKVAPRRSDVPTLPDLLSTASVREPHIPSEPRAAASPPKQPVQAKPPPISPTASRDKMRKVTAILMPNDFVRFKMLCAQLDKNNEQLLAEAINDVLAKHEG